VEHRSTPEAQRSPMTEDARYWMLLYPRLAAIFREVQHRTSCSVTEVAVLFALQSSGPMAAGVLRRNLSADAGHLSRILAALDRNDLVRVVVAADRRQRLVALTARGVERCAELAAVVTGVARENSLPLADLTQTWLC
jgi:DNA-binding MarR family transcriptional regulator